MNRVPNAKVTKAIIYGSRSYAIGPEDEPPADPSHTHRWTVYVRSANDEDLGQYVKKVLFTLHSSFKDPIRTVDKHPFEVTETGWGEFEIQMKIYFMDSSEKQIQLFHPLQLYPKTGVEPPASRYLIAEKYDEIIFNEPSEELLAALTPENPIKSAPWEFDSVYTEQYEAEELRVYNETNDKIVAETDKMLDRIQKAEEESRRLTAELNQMA